MQFFLYSKIIIILKCGRNNVALYKYVIVFWCNKYPFNQEQMTEQLI